jgi:hypothetical protein
MADTSKTETPITDQEFHTSKTGEDNRIDKAAQEAAEKASRTEKKYDRGQEIFTK